MYILTVLLQQWGQHHGPHYRPMGGAGGFGSGIHWSPWWVLVALVVLVGVVYLVGQLLRARDSTRSADAPDGALADLRKRYATGDIDAEEFEERRTRLSRRS